jgi:transposase InsO family protein
VPAAPAASAVGRPPHQPRAGQGRASSGPSRATVRRVLVRNGLVTPQAQEHKRTYRRWQRAAPMQLWQLDLAGGVPLADGREAKLVTGIDDHSRFVVLSAVVAVPSGRAVCEAFVSAMGRYGVPAEVLSDNGKQFTGRHTRPQPVEVLFARVCRHNGITHRLTKPCSPTTTGKIERFHKTLRAELLDHVAPFESLQAAQEAIDAWVSAYNYARPHQALGMATPASVFRPNGPTRADASSVPAEQAEQPEPSWKVELVGPPPAEPAGSGAVAFEVRVPPSGEVTLAAGRQKLSLPQGLAGRTLTVWADLRSIHLTLDGHLVRTLGSRLLPEDLRYLAMRGARPEPATPALPRLRGKPTIAPGGAIDVDRSVHRDGHVNLNGAKYQVGMAWAGRRITLRLDGHLLHAIADRALLGTWPCPIPTGRLAQLPGARPAATPLPPPPPPAGSIRVYRRVHASGRIMVARQPIKLGPRHAGSWSPSSSRTPACGSCTARKNSPSSPAGTPPPSPGCTSWANTPSTHDVPDVPRPISCTSPEPSHRHGRPDYRKAFTPSEEVRSRCHTARVRRCPPRSSPGWPAAWPTCSHHARLGWAAPRRFAWRSAWTPWPRWCWTRCGTGEPAGWSGSPRPRSATAWTCCWAHWQRSATASLTARSSPPWPTCANTLRR